MNKLQITANGGIPLFLNDLRFMQDASFDAVKGLFAFLPSNKVVVLKGLGNPDSTFHAEGYVYYNGEVFHVSENDEVPIGQQLLWDFTPSIDTSGNRETLTGDNITPFQIRKAKIIGLSVPPGNIPAGSIKFAVNGELDTDTIGFFNVLAQKLNSVPPGAVMMWFGAANNIPEGWEECVGQMGYFGSVFPTQAPDMRMSSVWGYDATGSAPFNSVGANYDVEAPGTSNNGFSYKTCIFIIKNGEYILPSFPY